MEIVIGILATVLTVITCKIMNRNTIGTTGAYAKRAFTVWIVWLFIIGALFGYA